MAIVAPMLTRQRILAAKAETTDGTAISLSASDAAFNIYDATMTPDWDVVPRPGQSSSDPLPAVSGGRRMNTGFSTFAHGKGSTGPPAWGLFLQACGFSLSTATYSLETGGTAYTSLSMALFEDGRKRTCTGCVGSFSAEFIAGQPCRINWNFVGCYADGSTTALITPTYPTVIPPRFATANAFQIASTSYRVASVTLSINNELKLREDQTTSGYRSGVVVHRDVRWTVDPESATAKDFYNDMRDHTEADITLVLGGVTYNKVTFNSPKCQIVSAAPSDRDGLLTDTLEFQANRNAAAGDDALTIVFA